MLRSLTTTRHLARRPGQPLSLLRRIAAALALRRQRRDLRRLPPHLLRDIGLTEDQARTEARRPIWDAPAHWHR